MPLGDKTGKINEPKKWEVLRKCRLLLPTVRE